MKLRSISLILSSFIIPLVSIGQEGMGTSSNVVIPKQRLSEPSASVDDFKELADVKSTALAFGDRLDALQWLPDGGRSIYLKDTTKQKNLKKADEKPAFQKPKVSGKTSKRKARKAKTSWH